MTVSVRVLDEAGQVNAAISGDYGATLWRTDLGGDPDTDAIWWQSTSAGGPNPLDFGHVRDPELDRLLRAGRSETDPRRRDAIYQAVSRRFAEQVDAVWLWYGNRAFSTAKAVQGLDPPPLPNAERPTIVAGIRPVVGLSIRR